MNVFTVFAIDFVLTVLIGFLLLAYLRPSLYRVLVDLCGGEDRARFWTALSAIVLIGAPVTSALGYVPIGDPGYGPFPANDAFFSVTRQLGQNMINFLIALIVLGAVVAFFALVAPRTRKEPHS